jgi:hypothetical protein
LWTAVGPILKILLVDKSMNGPTSKSVATAVDSHRRGGGSPSLEYAVVAPADHRKALRGARDGTMVFVSVGETDLSHRDAASGKARVLCESLSIAQRLAHDEPTYNVYLLRHSDASPFSGIDAVAALLAGVVGLVDDRVLLEEGVISALLEHRSRDRRSVSMVVAGKPATAVQDLKAMLENWEQHLEGDGGIDSACWRTAMALAQLDRLMPIGGLGEKYSFVKLAQALNVQKAVTSFQLSESDLRKVLSALASLWISESDPSMERVRLPNYAREHGFPPNQPVVIGLDDRELPKRLYDTCKAMELVQRDPIAGVVPRVLIRLPRRHSGRVPRRGRLS